MTSGVDEVYRLRQIAEALRSPGVDLRKTHIEDFANQIEEHINFFKSSLRKKRKNWQIKVASAFDDLAEQGRKIRQQKQVTYEWWLSWNLSMVSLTDPDKYHVQKDDKMEFDTIDDSKNRQADLIFGMLKRSDIAFLPTTKELGFMAINRALPFFAPLQIVQKNTTADEHIRTPLAFFEHDISHGEDYWDLDEVLYYNGVMQNKNAYKVTRQFIKRWEKESKNFSKKARKNMEMILFEIIHEEEMVPFLSTMLYGDKKDIEAELMANVTRNIYEKSHYLIYYPLNFITRYRKIKAENNENKKELKKLDSDIEKWFAGEIKDFVSFVTQINFHKSVKKPEKELTNEDIRELEADKFFENLYWDNTKNDWVPKNPELIKKDEYSFYSEKEQDYIKKEDWHKDEFDYLSDPKYDEP